MRDGHIHTNYCPHGSKDTMEKYIERAIELGITEISFTEHFPLPKEFLECYPQFNNDGNMQEQELEPYIKEVECVKEKYKNKLKINIGVEVDYIEGYEQEIAAMLNKYGQFFDDGILSVHIIKVGEKYFSIDYSQESFDELVKIAEGLDKVYQIYFETVKKSVEADIGKYKPTRVGHLNLVRIYSQDFVVDYSKFPIVAELLEAMNKNKYTIDYNIAGERKENCEIYIDDYLFRKLLEWDIKMIYGSDAHSAEDLVSLVKYIE
ncbi:histidinol-phosphatase HisJ [Candidatus Epulonipiscium viviparus]|uniref:histidinol-phosphatase HisJ n=1 Tax=Candidatus Epulonipiscium viviparus TaxID=420336 RepID=UPI00273808FF|nr:histidinol-phosphatase HisJ [Candidatus Epulopiscium viviparus]